MTSRWPDMGVLRRIRAPPGSANGGHGAPAGSGAGCRGPASDRAGVSGGAHVSNVTRSFGRRVRDADVCSTRSSSRHSLFTRTWRSRNTRVAKNRSSSSRARRADPLDHVAALADDDRLLRFPIDQIVQWMRSRILRSARLLEAIDDHRARKRDLGVRELQQLLAHHLRREEPSG